MIKLGMMIGDRYEILEKIGTGGMSDVYKAKCHKLNRNVAVKVLKQEFSENANFVSKFKSEAQAAAGLMHPNIVNVYDVGEENGIYYIVMELVEGITLKNYIEKKARLNYKEAVSIAIQVSLGIQAAHNNHIIHRDIKPQNIIISHEGKVKVADFGIAKAATSNTITSNVMGSVHYASPEQARGGYSDEKSDIYSLGITLFEMLTGRVPFNGDTTVAIAIKQIQEPMPSPREFVPEIPQCVEDIVLKCCQKSPDRRYRSVGELLADLKHSLVHPEDDFVVCEDTDAEGATRNITKEDMDQLNKIRLKDEVLPSEEGGEYDEGYEEERGSKMEKISTILAVTAGIGIFIILFILAIGLIKNLSDKAQTEPDSPIQAEDIDTVEYVTMPSVTGLKEVDARNALSNLGLTSTVEYQESDTYDLNVVISANILTGEEIAKGSTVTLTVSAGTLGVEVPVLGGYTRDEAESKLTSLGFLVNVTEDYSDTVEVGRVVSQNPVGGVKVPKGNVITICISKGKEELKTRVPSLLGLSEEEATIVIYENQLTIGTVGKIYTTEYPEGTVCYQSEPQGSYVNPKTAIDIKISLGAVATTYYFDDPILAPTTEEAPDYVPGTMVHVMLKTEGGQILYDRDTSDFPLTTSFQGLSSSRGTIIMTYTVLGEATTVTNPETGEVTTVPGEKQEKTIVREVDFKKNQG